MSYLGGIPISMAHSPFGTFTIFTKQGKAEAFALACWIIRRSNMARFWWKWIIPMCIMGCGLGCDIENSPRLSRKNCPGLTEIPHGDNPSRQTVTSITMIGNSLQNIEWFPPYPVLETIDFREEMSITEFPNLSNVSSTLKTLKIRNGNLRHIEASYLQALVELEFLDVGNNSLTAPIPDMSPTAGTKLNRLMLRRNNFTGVPDIPVAGLGIKQVFLTGCVNLASISPLAMSRFRTARTFKFMMSNIDTFPDLCPLAEIHNSTEHTNVDIDFTENFISYIPRKRLSCIKDPKWEINLSQNWLSSLPNLLHADVMGTLNLDLNKMHCDCGLLWLKVAEGSMALFVVSNLVCDTPSHLSGMAFSSLSVGDLQSQCAGKLTCFVLYLRSIFTQNIVQNIVCEERFKTRDVSGDDWSMLL